jgi:hypothetical protein
MFAAWRETQRKTVPEMIADWLREASVLTAVFGVLDSLGRKEPFDGPWNVAVISIAAVFFALGVALEHARPMK